ncbi:MAG: flagellar assembly protein FliW [Bdellovibrionales bacterium]|nr:flagellar assembly protein FliW [Bdellovibrionales bacterium]
MADGKTIKFQTTRFGELEVRGSSVITVINGVIGFPQSTRYTLLEYNPPFSWLQSVEHPELAFVVVNGAEFGDGYRFPVPFGDRDMELGENDDLAIVNLVSVRPDPTQTTVNLKAPLLVNLRNMKGKQIVLDDPKFPIRMPLWADDEKK